MEFLYLLLIIPFVKGDSIVNTNSGPVRGTCLSEKKVEAFLGIPYAEPPVGPLRFAKPVAKSSWKVTYEANELPPACVQAFLGDFSFTVNMTEESMNEDCLYLNLWVPEGGSDLKTVMVFIHGGGFMTGSSNMKIYDGAELSKRGDVIVATINYRVGTLGFFSGNIDEAAGSMGMYDQVMALQWIKENAEHFGGDPDNIVLFGESAGSYSVSMHMISPLSKNLFNRGILQSGSSFHPMYSDDNRVLLLESQLIANLSGCANDNQTLMQNPEDVVSCMKNLPAEKISEVDAAFMYTSGILIPRVGDDFLPTTPVDLFREGKFKDTEVLLGITRDEGSLLLSTQKPGVFSVLGEKVDFGTFNKTLSEKILQDILKIHTGSDTKLFSSYFDRARDESRYTYLNTMSDIMGDFFITCGAVFQADYQSLRNNPMYFYLFDYRSPSSPYAEWMEVAHFDEVQYVFGNPMISNFTPYEKELSKDIMDMWTTFAKTGNPIISKELKWPQYTYEDPKYFVIGQRDSIGIRPDNYRCEVWRNFFRSVIDEDVLQNLHTPVGKYAF